MSTIASHRTCAAIFFAVILSVAKINAQQLTPLSNGTTATTAGTTLQVTALRDNILRVRVWKGDAQPEDAS
jgi:hypothetical protein